jgi:hypothetical protein
VLAAALALLLLAPAPARAQESPRITLGDRPLGNDDAGLVVELLGTWRELLEREAARVQDPLAWIRRHAPAQQVIVPPGATYDPACSLMMSEAVFTMGVQPSPQEMRAEVARLMRTEAGLERVRTGTQPTPPAVTDAATAMAVLGQVLGGKGPLAAEARQGIADSHPMDGPSSVRTGRLHDWYVARGFGVDGWADHTGEPKNGATLDWDKSSATDEVVVHLEAITEMPALRPVCGHLPRGPLVSLTLGGMDGLSTDTDRYDGFTALALAMPYDGTDEITRPFAGALRRAGIEGLEFERLLLMVTEAEWLAGQPRLLEAMVAEARRDPTNDVARAVMHKAENVKWFTRHEATLRPALAAWRAAFARR